MKRVLSIDGGGVKGIIPAVVLSQFEKKTDKRIVELFDMVVGTSSGGIIALAITEKNALGEPRHTALDIVDIYRKNAKKIFKRGLVRKLATLCGIIKSRYDHSGLQTITDEYFVDSEFGECLVPTMVTAYELTYRRSKFFKSWKESTKPLRKTDLAVAISAAPTYFEPKQLTIDGWKGSYIDGAVHVNNPAMAAYVEAKKMWPDEQILVVSLGTGEFSRKIKHKDARRWGIMQWAIPLIDIIFDGQSDTVDHQLSSVIEGDFIRFQTTLTLANNAMDDASDENIENLIMQGHNLIEREKKRIDETIQKLVDRE